MFFKKRWLGAACLAACVFGSLAVKPAAAQNNSHRQYYGNWRSHSSAGYHYRPYYYKPSPSHVGFRHHYVIHHPKHPKHLYFYNPRTKQYWGRCPVDADGKAAYSLLAEKDRSGNLEKIPEAAFPPPGAMPPIPDSTDGALLDLPPDDLPTGFGGE